MVDKTEWHNFREEIDRVRDVFQDLTNLIKDTEKSLKDIPLPLLVKDPVAEKIKAREELKKQMTQIVTSFEKDAIQNGFKIKYFYLKPQDTLSKYGIFDKKLNSNKRICFISMVQTKTGNNFISVAYKHLKEPHWKLAARYNLIKRFLENGKTTKLMRWSGNSYNDCVDMYNEFIKNNKELIGIGYTDDILVK